MGLDRLKEVSNDKILNEVRRFSENVSQLDGIEDIILFGSLADGKMTEASDIDIAFLIADHVDKKEISEKIRKLKREQLSWPADLVIFKKSWFESRKNYGGLCFEINAKGKWLYSSGREFNRES